MGRAGAARRLTGQKVSGRSYHSVMVAVRDATSADVDFIAWVMLTASRSQLDRGIWEYLYDLDEASALRFLRQVTVTDEIHLFHHSLFMVAEVDGEPAAAMCGYDPPTQGFGVLGTVMPRVLGELDLRVDEVEMARRSDVLLSGFPPDPAEHPWIIENVATKPGFRRLGLVDQLLCAQLDRGRDGGYHHAQISVFLGNEPARRAYVNAGFESIDEQRSDGWAEEIGCAGVEVMLQPLRARSPRVARH